MGDWGRSRCLKVRRINDDPCLVSLSDAIETIRNLVVSLRESTPLITF